MRDDEPIGNIVAPLVDSFQPLLIEALASGRVDREMLVDVFHAQKGPEIRQQVDQAFGNGGLNRDQARDLLQPFFRHQILSLLPTSELVIDQIRHITVNHPAIFQSGEAVVNYIMQGGEGLEEVMKCFATHYHESCQCKPGHDGKKEVIDEVRNVLTRFLYLFMSGGVGDEGDDRDIFPLSYTQRAGQVFNYLVHGGPRFKVQCTDSDASVV